MKFRLGGMFSGRGKLSIRNVLAVLATLILGGGVITLSVGPEAPVEGEIRFALYLEEARYV